MQPTVSIIIPAYNASAFIGRTLDSCLAQTYTDYEIIVVDDGSSDGTGDVVTQQYVDTVQLIMQDNRGAGYARNTGIRAANGHYLKFLDADDVLHPTHLEAVMQRFRAVDDHVAMVYTQYREIQDGTITLPDKRLAEGDIFCPLLLDLVNTFMFPSTVTVRKEALLETGFFPDDKEWIYAEDWVVWLQITHDYDVAVVEDYLVDRHWHTSNVSNNNLIMRTRIANAMAKVRDFPKRKACISDAEYDDLVGGRFHDVAMREWQMGNRQRARYFLQRASETTPQSRRARQLYRYLTYFLPQRVVDDLNKLLRLLR